MQDKSIITKQKKGDANLKIISLQAENVKKLIAVEINPKGNLVEITGKNGQGKTSVLDSIWWALSGAANIQGSPIRKGEDTAIIKLDFGEFKVTRTFSRLDNRTTSSIKIEDAKGTAIRQPQTMLDKLLGELSFDPLAFARMTKKEQFEQLKRFVPDVDFEAIEKAQQEDYDLRTNVNRQAHEAKVLADKIEVAIEAGEVEADEALLVSELEKAGKLNADLETRKANRAKLAQEAAGKRKEVAGITQGIHDKNEQIERLKSEIQAMRGQITTLEDEAVKIDEKLAAAKPLPQPIDTSAITADIAKARESNKKFELLRQKNTHLAVAAENKEESDKITARMNARTADKQAKIAKAKLPVPGLGFGDSEILINDVPFNQASDAEQLQVSIAMAMALNPTIRVIRVRDGSLLDKDSLAMLSKMADEKDYQVWVETVQSDSPAAIVLEDGQVKSAGVAVAKKQEVVEETEDII